MLCIPPKFVFEDLLGFDILTITSKITGVTRRTFKNNIQGRNRPKPGTIRAIIDGTKKCLQDNNPYAYETIEGIWDDIFRSENTFFWSQFLDAINAGSYPDILFPNTQKLILEFERYAQRTIETFKSDGFESTLSYISALKLPSTSLNQTNIDAVRKSCDISKMSLLNFLTSLDLLLYLIASIDVEINEYLDDEIPAKSKFSRFLPVKTNDSFILPIARFFKWVQTTKFETQSEMIEFIDNKINDLNGRSIRRQMHRWMKGEALPRWNKLDKITEVLFDDYDFYERRFSIAPIILFQKVFTFYNYALKRNLCSGNLDDVMEVFGQYEKWFSELSYH